ncbi:hypothetical protein MTR67_007069 [Solanum verrucosum]|uniref:Uncharacterized protein n=2 Tax=Solanum verrucosum TaxID=315347 RepID=A0AAF0Q5D5_SOLVR|nr:hypothetical protein MTR67_007069 [Solanum verrucosum]
MKEMQKKASTEVIYGP